MSKTERIVWIIVSMALCTLDSYYVIDCLKTQSYWLALFNGLCAIMMLFVLALNIVRLLQGAK